MKLRLVGVILVLLVVGAFSFSVFSFASSDLTRSVKGKILLDVEQNGEAWYVHPLTEERYFLSRPADAFQLMRLLGLGVSNQNLERIPIAGTSLVGDRSLRYQLAGRILLEVESNGEAWYVDPVSLQRHYLGTPQDAFSVMNKLGVGITHEQLQSIPDGGLVHASIVNDVPFTPQAPFAEWSDLRQQEGCEEASVLMAMHWIWGTEISADQAKEQILTMADRQEKYYGFFVDTSAQDTDQRLFKQYFGYEHTEVQYDIDPSDIRDELAKGNLVVVPVNGKSIQNPFFRNGGPQRHMIVVTGFDWTTGEFITNEPGTKRGRDYRYDYQTMRESLRDYPSGNYVPIPKDSPSAMIIVKKN